MPNESKQLQGSYFVAFEQALGIARKRLEQYYRAHGIDVPHVWVLTCAREANCYQKQIAVMLGLNLNTMVEIVDEMEEQGIIRRERNPDNRREVFLKPTRKGLKLMEWVDKQWDEAAQVAFYPVTLKELKLARDRAAHIIEVDGVM